MESSNLQLLMEASLERSSQFTKTIMPKSVSASDVIKFINGQRSAIISTVRKNGSPHNAWNPIAFVGGKLYTYADPHSIFFKNISRDGRVAVAIASGNRAVFIEGRASEVGPVTKLVDNLLAEILSQVKGWIPKSSYNYSSFEECEASIFEIKISKILSYDG